MSLQSTKLYGMLHERLDWLAQRHRVLSQNIANSDTPGYKARDLDRLDFKKTLRGSEKITLARTDEKHVMAKSDASTFNARRLREPYEMSISGNSVVLENEMAKLASNQADYNIATKLFSKYNKMHALALTGKF